METTSLKQNVLPLNMVIAKKKKLGFSWTPDYNSHHQICTTLFSSTGQRRDFFFSNGAQWLERVSSGDTTIPMRCVYTLNRTVPVLARQFRNKRRDKLNVLGLRGQYYTWSPSLTQSCDLWHVPHSLPHHHPLPTHDQLHRHIFEKVKPHQIHIDF